MKKILDKVKSFLFNDSFHSILIIIGYILLIVILANLIIIDANAVNEPSNCEAKYVTHITDLTNTTWFLNDIVILDMGIRFFNIDYKSNGNYYNIMDFVNWSDSGSGENYIRYTNSTSNDYIDVFEGNINSSSLSLQADEEYLTITISGGEDVHEMWLINWLYANGTLITEPDILSFSIHDSDAGEIIATYSYLEGMTFGEWANSEYNVDGFTIYSGQPDYGLTLNFNFNFIVADILSTEQCYIDCIILSTNGMFPVTDDYLIQSVLAYTLTPTVLYNSCFHDGYLSGYDSGYDPGYDDGYDSGYESGYDEGYDIGHDIGYTAGESEGYYNGLSMGESSTIGRNFLGDLLSAPIRALNNLVIINTPSGFSISVWNIVSTLIGIALFIWFLKMFAGG